MATEAKPIPRLAKSAATLAQAEFQTTINNLGIQTLEAMGLSTDQGWSVNFTLGVATREVPDIAPAPPAPGAPATAAAPASTETPAPAPLVAAEEPSAHLSPETPPPSP